MKVMTNADYFRATLTDRELADMAGFIAWAHNKRLANAFKKWCAEFGSVKSNQKHNNPSPYFWQKIFNRDTDKWERTTRTQNVSVQIFLSKPYKKEYWEETDL